MIRKASFTIIFILALVALLPPSRAQIFHIKGQVVDARGEGISQVYLIFSETGEVHMAGDSGRFDLQLDVPVNTLLVKKPGHVPQKLVFPFHYGETLSITLDAIDSTTPFDAEEVINKAISAREKNEEKYVFYKAKAYKKNRASINRIPFQLWKASGLLVPSPSDSGIVFISEKYADFNYAGADNFDEKLMAYQAAGRISVPGWHYVADLDMSLYHEKLFLKNISSIAYHSPLSEKSLKYYHFTPAGSYYEGERKIYRIKMEPKRQYSQNFNGFIDFYGDSLYNLSSVEIYLGDQNLLEVVDSFKLREVYYYSDTAYHQASQHQQYYLNIIGFKFRYDIFTFFKEHRFFTTPPEPDYDRQVVTLTLKDITSEKEVWDTIRPVQTPQAEERVFHAFPHSARWITQEQMGVDPLFEAKKFRFTDLITGGYDFDNARATTNLSPFWSGLGYNTVEGPYMRYDIEHIRYFTDSEVLLHPEIRYGFSSNTLYYDLEADYFFDLDHPRMIGIQGGHGVEQFNRDQPISPLINSLYSLFLSRNYLKLYARNYAELSYEWEVINGLEGSLSLRYAYRYPLYNTTHFRIIGNPDLFTPNNLDFPPAITSEGFEPHHALNTHFSLVYQFNQLYKMINGRKINLQSTAPQIYFNYFKGIPSPVSETDFDHLNIGLSFQKRLGRVGLSKFDGYIGGFLQNRSVPFIDYKHFNGVQTFFLQPTPRLDNSIREFSTLPYYDYSTNYAYVEAHYEHSFDGLLLGRGQLLGPLKLHSFFGLNYLNTFSRAQFLEFFVGIDNILNVMRLEFAGGFDNFLEFEPSIRIGVDFDYRYYLDHRKKNPETDQP